MSTIEPRVVPSYCKVCEALCGVPVHIGDSGRIERVVGDSQHPVSRGYVCPKAASMAHAVDDSERVVEPMQRGSNGTFVPVSWEEAMTDISSRMRMIIDRHGPHALAMNLGNPSAFSLSHMFWAKGFMEAVGSRVSHGSIVSLPRIGDHLRAIVQRGGSVVVVDPVRTRTAAAFEHVPIRPQTDAWLLAAMIRQLFVDGDVNRRHVSVQARGLEELEAAVDRFDATAAASATGLGGWEYANARGGADVNVLASCAVDAKDPLSGASHLDGLSVVLRPRSRTDAPQQEYTS